MNMRRALVILAPYLWLLALFLIPFGIVFKISLSDLAIARPPYVPTLDIYGGWAAIREFFANLDFENFVFLTTDDLYWKAYLSSLRIAFTSTLLTLLVGYPIAYAMSRATPEWRPTLMMLVILPFWTSFLIRVYAWMGILSTEGVLNQFLMGLEIISEPLVTTPRPKGRGFLFLRLQLAVCQNYASLHKQRRIALPPLVSGYLAAEY